MKKFNLFASLTESKKKGFMKSMKLYNNLIFDDVMSCNEKFDSYQRNKKLYRKLLKCSDLYIKLNCDFLSKKKYNSYLILKDEIISDENLTEYPKTVIDMMLLSLRAIHWSSSNYEDIKISCGLIFKISHFKSKKNLSSIDLKELSSITNYVYVKSDELVKKQKQLLK